MKLKKKNAVLCAFLFMGLCYMPMIAPGRIVLGEGINITNQVTDLEVSWIGLGDIGHTSHPPKCLATSVKNIGNTTVGEFRVHYELRGLFFPRMITFGSATRVGLQPDQEITLQFEETKDLPKFGLFQFTCEVNRNREVPEDNYDNNKKTVTLMAFLGYWQEIS